MSYTLSRTGAEIDAIGTFSTSGEATVDTVSSGTRTSVASVTLEAGVWILSGQVRLSNSSGLAFTMQVGMSSTSGAVNIAWNGYEQVSVATTNTAPSLNSVQIISSLSSSITMYLTVYQNSGSDMTVTTTDSRIRAVRIK